MRIESLIVRRIHSEQEGRVDDAVGVKPEGNEHPRVEKRGHLHEDDNENA